MAFYTRGNRRGRLRKFITRTFGGRPRRRAIVHAGLHKTGTTAIQNYLGAHASEFLSKGFLYPQAGRLDGSAGHHNLAWQLSGDHRFDPAYGIVDQAVKEIGAFSGDAILSSEDFESCLGDAGRLLPLTENEALRGKDIIFLIHIRDQVSYAESLFFQMIQHGMPYEAKSFCDIIVETTQISFKDWVFHFDYELFTKVIGQTSAAELALRPYRALVGGSSITDLLHVLNPDEPGFPAHSNSRDNKRMTLTQSIAMFCGNRLKADVAELTTRLEATLGLKLGNRNAYLSFERRRAIQSRFGESNNRVARAFGFSKALLIGAEPRPADSVDLERVFSENTAEVVGMWLDGKCSADTLIRLIVD
jgi:hypothetical protein